tara:strand:- start:962 stop:2161 length:1200 start_codon:yes stop_codon:yes gene_type:complete
MEEQQSDSLDRDGSRSRRRLHLRGVESADSDSVYDGIGSHLKKSREHQGIRLAEVSSQIRISEFNLRAIEGGRFDDLPGTVYAIGFLRTYAKYLGLDEGIVVDSYRGEIDLQGSQAQLSFPSLTTDSRIPGQWLIAGSLALVVVVYAGWYYISDEDRVAVELVPEVSETEVSNNDVSDGALERLDSDSVIQSSRLDNNGSETLPHEVDNKQLKTVLTESSNGGISSIDGEDKFLSPRQRPSTKETSPIVAIVRQDENRVDLETEALQSGEADGLESAEAMPDQDRMKQESVPAEVSGSNASAVYGADTTDARVVISARRDSWIQVYDSNGEILFKRVLLPGDSFVVPNRVDIWLMTSNAGALEFVVDGATLPPVGGDGEVLRELALDAKSLLEVQSVEP